MAIERIYPQSKRQQGFTLVELIIVIVVMGILSFGTVQFILNTSDAYGDAARRERMGATRRVTVEKIAREVRTALPNSARVGLSGGGIHCLEFVPVLDGSNYVDLPVLAASTGFSSIPFINAPELGRVAVYPLSVAGVYDLTASQAVVSPAVTTVAADLVSSAVVSVSFSPSSHQFPTDSPSKRWFMVDTPVSFCLDGNQLFRYQNYGFFVNQPFPDAAPVFMSTTTPDRQLVAGNVTAEAAGVPFVVIPPTLQRNGMVQMDLSFKIFAEGLRISHEVQLRNVP